MTAPALPRLFVTVPGVEDLDSVIGLLRAAGARITERRREFVIDGPLSPAQGTAVWWLARHLDGNSEGDQLDLRVEPTSDLPSALAVLCPDGYDGSGAWDSDPRTDDPHDPPTGSNHDWWTRQQNEQRAMVTAAKASAAAPAVPLPAPEQRTTCCGNGAAWGATEEGAPFALGCAFCPASGERYWRNRRADTAS